MFIVGHGGNNIEFERQGNLYENGEHLVSNLVTFRNQSQIYSKNHGES